MKKLNFDEIKNTLDREEMKNIMAGSGGAYYQCCYIDCSSCSDPVYIPAGSEPTCGTDYTYAMYYGYC